MFILKSKAPKARFLLDENVDARVAPFLEKKGYDVILCPKGLRNGEVLALAEKEGRILLTNDSDFSDTDIYDPADYVGIVVFRVHPPSLINLQNAIDNLLSNFAETRDFVGKTLTVTEEGAQIE